MNLRKTIGILAGMLLLALPILAQDAALTLPPFVAVVDEQLQLVQSGAMTPITERPVYQYNATWSPDGAKLAYVVSADPANEFSDQKTIVVYEVATGTSFDLVTDRIATGFPLSWTLDGQLLYLVDTGAVDDSTEGGMIMLFTAKVIRPEAGAQPDTTAERVPFGAGCGGGSSIPMDWLTWEESDFGGSKAVLQLTDYGIVHSGQCIGARTSLTRPFSGETVPFAGGNLSNAVVSPDGQKVAGVAREPGSVAGILTVVDLATLQETTYDTAAVPYALAWGNDGTLYYSTRTVTSNLLANLTPEQVALFNQVIGVIEPQMTDFPAYSAGIYARNINDATDASGETLLYEANVYAIPRLAVAGDMLFFSEVNNGDAWIQAMLDGIVTFETNFDVAADYAILTLKVLNLTDASVQVVGEDLRQFAVVR
jgi:hypothetical protein